MNTENTALFFSLPSRPRIPAAPRSPLSWFLASAGLFLPCLFFEVNMYNLSTTLSFSWFHALLFLFWTVLTPALHSGFLKKTALGHIPPKALWFVKTLCILLLCLGFWQLDLYSALRKAVLFPVDLRLYALLLLALLLGGRLAQALKRRAAPNL